MSIKKIFSAVFLYISAIIGAGFAAGRELNVYFFDYGFISGIIGIFAASLLFAVAAYKVLLLGSIFKIKSCKAFTAYLFGGKTGAFFNTAGIMFFAVLFASMTAAFGEICRGIGINMLWAKAIFCIICFIALSFDIKGLSVISTLLCPLMLAGCCIVGLRRLFTGNIPLDMPRIIVLPSSVLYVSYNILTGAAVLIRGEKYNKKEAFLTAVPIFFAFFIAGIFAGTAAFGSKEALPIYAAVKDGRVLLCIYTAVLLSAIFTTALSSAYCLTPYLDKARICTVGFVLSLIGFANIVEKFYFVFGIIGSGVLFALLFCPIYEKKKRLSH